MFFAKQLCQQRNDEMKKIKIPIEILFKLFGNNVSANNDSKKGSNADRIIEKNKRYFNHIGVA